MEWSIQQIAGMAGTTSRALRHYDDIGLLPPSRTGSNGYRYYDQTALVRLQRILLLRELGLGLPEIAAVLERETSEVHALTGHLAWLRQERRRLTRQMASVQATIDALEGGESLMAHDMFDGFDHTQYKDEVIERWGADDYNRSDAWWRAMTADEKVRWHEVTAQLSRDWSAAAVAGVPIDGPEATALAERHVAWLRSIPGTPAAAPERDVKGYVIGLGEMYVADDRFGANYGGDEGARFVRDALTAYAEANL